MVTLLYFFHDTVSCIEVESKELKIMRLNTTFFVNNTELQQSFGWEYQHCMISF